MKKDRVLLIAALVLAAGLGFKILTMVQDAGQQRVATAPSAPIVRRPLDEMFAGSKPGMVGLPPGVELGMTEDALAKVSPELAAGGLTTPEGVVCVPEISRESHTVEAMNMLLGVDLPTAERALVTAWGEPARGKDAPDKPALFWHDEARGVRAVLRATAAGTHVEVRRLVTTAAMLGEKGPRLGLESKGSFVGASVADLAKAYVVIPRAADASGGADVMIVFPPTEFGWRETRAYGYASGGKVTRFTVEIEYGRGPEGTREKILRAIDEKLGAAEIFDAGALGSYRVYDRERLVIVRDEPTFGAWHLSFEAGRGARDAGRD